MILRELIGIVGCLIVLLYALKQRYKNILSNVLLFVVACTLLFVQFGNWEGVDAQAHVLYLQGVSSLQHTSASSLIIPTPRAVRSTVRPIPTARPVPAAHPTPHSARTTLEKQRPQIQAAIVVSPQQSMFPHIPGSLLGVFICLAIVVVFLFLATVIRGPRRRRGGVSSILCPSCGQPATLRKYRLGGGRMGLMCSDCAGRLQAAPAGR